MADISRYLQAIMAAIYGRDVRSSIHDAIDIINKVSEKTLNAGTAIHANDVVPSSSTDPKFGYLYSEYIDTTNNDLLRVENVSGVLKWVKVQNIEGNGIDSIDGPVVDPDDPTGLTDLYTVNFTKSAETFPLKVKNAKSITSITGPVPKQNDPLTDVFTINYNDGTNRTFEVSNGMGITSITGPVAHETYPLVDVYTINYNDGTSRTFNVTNGKSIVSITGPVTSDLTDTYTITYNDNTTQTYTVTNGNKIYQGTAIAGEDPTQQVIAPTSGIAHARTGDLYNNTAEGSFYHCVTPGDPTTAAWLYDFTVSAVATAIDWANITNKPLGVANGVATLDANGLVPLAQLPLSPEVILPVNPNPEPTTNGAIWISVIND